MPAFPEANFTMPDKTQSETVFDANIKLLLAYLKTFGANINQFGAQMVALIDAEPYDNGATYNFPDSVVGSDGLTYRCTGTGVTGDDPVGSITGNWVALILAISDLYNVIHNDIVGGNVTVSGNTLTITPCSCWDSTRSVWLESTENDTAVIPGTSNLNSDVYIVRLAADSSIVFKSYDHAGAGPAGDATVNAYRFIGGAKNDAAGVTMPFIQIGDEYFFTGTTAGTTIPTLAATITNSFAAYSVATVLPWPRKGRMEIVSLAGGGVEVSYDGTNAAWVNTSATNHPDVLAVDSLYLKYTSSSSVIKIRRFTLRR